MQGLRSYEKSTLPDSQTFDWDQYKWRTCAEYAVILNFNGVLLASRAIDSAAWKWLFEQLGDDVDDDTLAELLDGGVPTWLSLLTHGNREGRDWSKVVKFAMAMSAMREQYKVAVFLTKGREMRGARQLLEKLDERRIPLGLYSLFSQRSVLEILRATGLKKFFSVVVTPDVLGRRESEDVLEDCLNAVAERLGVLKEKCFLVEDSAPRVRTATELGLACIGVAARSKRKLRDEGAIHVVNDLLPLVPVFGKSDTKQSVVDALVQGAVGPGRGRKPKAVGRKSKAVRRKSKAVRRKSKAVRR